ncbi:Triosephosphate isomerase [Butyriboletus roseoflavus]|nr:Triosephosphate isomerase [Butyriboletus roseoflavus]
MPRQFFVGGNFKMNPGSVEQKKHIVDLLNQVDLDPETGTHPTTKKRFRRTQGPSTIEVVIAPPALYLIPLKSLLRKEIQLAAQNCHFERLGAFTGEISPIQLVDAEIPYVILGHSERRTLFHETSELVAKKTKAALDASLRVILCVGETLAEREAGRTTEVVNEQLQAVVDVLKGTVYWNSIVIAYEPVWAIGTGKVATAVQAQDAHAEIRRFLETKVSESVAGTTRIIYGGSVNAANAKELSTQPDIDGFLVGGASLKPEFVDIINVKRQ